MPYPASNDRFGHAVGDEVLRKVAACLERNRPSAGHAARILPGIAAGIAQVPVVRELGRDAIALVDHVEETPPGQGILDHRVALVLDVVQVVHGGQPRAPGHADHADPVQRRAHQPRHRGAVARGLGVVGAVIVAQPGIMQAGIVIGGQVHMGLVHAVVVDADMDAGAADLLPDRLDVADEIEMPLLRVARIGDDGDHVP